MTKQEYDELRIKVMSFDEGYFRWELIKALWELTRVVRGSLDD